mmetsp:Transcript_97/g.93  ORF Transcript_97/g.93 Transcript_97/m.93 type:complete len:369 (+) Transcript_97:33-1139(+)
MSTQHASASLLTETKKGVMGMGRKMKSTRFTETMPKEATANYILPSESDDTDMQSQGSTWSINTSGLRSVGTGSVWTMATQGTMTVGSVDSDVETILKGDDFNYVKQKYGTLSIIIAIIQLFFLTMMISLCGFAPIGINPSIGPFPDSLSLFGAHDSYSIFVKNQWWRFITSPLVNAGILHFLCNTFIQLELGAFFEREWGSFTWLTIYMSSSFSGMVFDSALSGDGVCVTSSAVLMGLFGAKCSEIIMIMNFKTWDSHLVDCVHQLTAVLFTLAFMFLLVCLPYVEWSGHLGGFFAGFVISMPLFSHKIKYSMERRVWSGCGILCTIGLSIILWNMMHNVQPNEDLEDICGYYENLHPENYICQCAA